jgi:MFS family permease
MSLPPTIHKLMDLERARKVNIWAFTFLFGAFFGPMMSSFLLSKISWEVDMGVLAIWYGVSALLVAICGEETLYDREKGISPTAGASRLSLLIGTAGWKSKGQSSLVTVSKHLVSVGIKPQLLLPCKPFFYSHPFCY